MPADLAACGFRFAKVYAFLVACLMCHASASHDPLSCPDAFRTRLLFLQVLTVPERKGEADQPQSQLMLCDALRAVGIHAVGRLSGLSN